jgi:hypothetical protein
MTSRFGQAAQGSAGSGGGLRMGFRLRYRDQELPLPRGLFIIGRSADAGLLLDDAAVSRRHATLDVRDDSVLIEDLGSSNGVFVNGARVLRHHYLQHGDCLLIGAQEMWLLATPESGFMPIGSIPPSTPEIAVLDEDTHQLGEMTLRAGIADKAFTRRQADQAERALSGALFKLLETARIAGRIAPLEALRAARYAVKLACHCRSAAWFDYVIDLYTVGPLAMPSELVEELFLALREVPNIDLAKMDRYAKLLRPRAQNLNSDEQRGLELVTTLKKLAALK